MIFFLYIEQCKNATKNIEKCDTTHGETTEDSNNDFNMIMDKKFEEFKTYITSEFTESAKHIIEIKIQSILRGYQGPFRKGYFSCRNTSASFIKPEVQ